MSRPAESLATGLQRFNAPVRRGAPRPLRGGPLAAIVDYERPHVSASRDQIALSKHLVATDPSIRNALNIIEAEILQDVKVALMRSCDEEVELPEATASLLHRVFGPVAREATRHLIVYGFVVIAVEPPDADDADDLRVSGQRLQTEHLPFVRPIETTDVRIELTPAGRPRAQAYDLRTGNVLERAKVFVVNMPDTETGSLTSSMQSVTNLLVLQHSLLETAQIAARECIDPAVLVQKAKPSASSFNLDPSNLFFDSEARNDAAAQNANESHTATQLAAALTAELNRLRTTVYGPSNDASVSSKAFSTKLPRLSAIPAGLEATTSSPTSASSVALSPQLVSLCELTQRTTSAAMGVQPGLEAPRFASNISPSQRAFRSTADLYRSHVNQGLDWAFRMCFPSYRSSDARLQLASAKMSGFSEDLLKILPALVGANLVDLEAASESLAETLGFACAPKPAANRPQQAAEEAALRKRPRSEAGSETD